MLDEPKAPASTASRRSALNGEATGGGLLRGARTPSPAASLASSLASERRPAGTTPRGRGARSAFFRAQRERAAGKILTAATEPAPIQAREETSLIVPIAAVAGCMLLAMSTFGWLG